MSELFKAAILGALYGIVFLLVLTVGELRIQTDIMKEQTNDRSNNTGKTRTPNADTPRGA